MKRLRTQRLNLNFGEPLHPVSYEQGKSKFAKMKEELTKRFLHNLSGQSK